MKNDNPREGKQTQDFLHHGYFPRPGKNPDRVFDFPGRDSRPEFSPDRDPGRGTLCNNFFIKYLAKIMTLSLALAENSAPTIFCKKGIELTLVFVVSAMNL